MTPKSHAPFFYADESDIHDEFVSLAGDEFQHLCRIRRAGQGDFITVTDGAGTVVEAVIDEIGRSSVRARIVNRRIDPVPIPAITVYQGIAKGEKMDLTVQKLVEVGVDAIAIFAAGRSVPRWDEGKKRSQLARWSRIATEAAKQSHASYLPKVSGPLPFSEIVEQASLHELVLVGDPRADSGVEDAFGGTPVASVAIVIGPEGGLSEKELAELAAVGAIPVSLGSRPMRTETAGLVLASIAGYLCGRLRPAADKRTRTSNPTGGYPSDGSID